jgi:hypothetical protein
MYSSNTKPCTSYSDSSQSTFSHDTECGEKHRVKSVYTSKPDTDILISNSADSVGINKDDAWKTKKALDVKRKLESFLFGSISGSASGSASGSTSEFKYFTITNKTRRQIKKFFNEEVNLTDRMFQGFHKDGSIIGSHNDNEKEINLLCQVLKKTPTLSFEKASKTIKKWIYVASEYRDIIESDVHDSDIHDSATIKTKSTISSKKKELIIGAYQKYMEEVKAKKAIVKTRGLDLSSECYQYWKSNRVDPILEEQINKMSTSLYNFLLSSFDETFTFEDFEKSLLLVLDISGSMAGKPINIGLFYMLMMTKIFKLKKLYYFENKLEIVYINKYSSNLELINNIYKHVYGGTELDAVFTHFNKEKICGKNVVIITDGDCDPTTNISYCSEDTVNPFHEVTKIDKSSSKYPHIRGCNFVIVNVKQEKLNFPYLNMDPSVCYLTGNNPKILNAFVKALCESTKSGININPQLVLKYSLLLDELNFEYPVPLFSNAMSLLRIEKLFLSFQKNLPPKSTSETHPLSKHD